MRRRNRRAAFGAQKRAPKQQVAVAAAAKRETRGPVHRPGAAGCAIRPAAKTMETKENAASGILKSSRGVLRRGAGAPSAQRRKVKAA